MVIKVVIGANFGDEGKGLMTDYFCHQSALQGEKCIVVLHNGGAQRGHTVATPDGKRHVFHHFGSGTFTGADTYLSEDFILNPMVFRQEWEELEKMGITPNVFVHHACMVTTPFDMIINQIIEAARNNSRHGSCGMGIYETILRDICNYPCEMWYDSSSEAKRFYLMEIRNYLVERLANVGIDEIPGEWKKIIYSDYLIENFIYDLEFMRNHVSVRFDKFIEYYDCVVFENGQGLLLDQNNKEYFPHLTPSNTGIKNPFRMISETILNMQRSAEIEVCYVTRTYLTRHGAGRLDGECDKAEINPNIQDLTNIPNPHQGTLRYAKLDEKSLIERILKDFEPFQKEANISLAITHTNEHDIVLSDESKQSFDYIYYSNNELRDHIWKIGVL